MPGTEVFAAEFTIQEYTGADLVRGKDDGSGNAMASINKGFYSSAAISLIAFAALAHFYMHEWRAFFSVASVSYWRLYWMN
jgi:hypothetical protein